MVTLLNLNLNYKPETVFLNNRFSYFIVYVYFIFNFSCCIMVTPFSSFVSTVQPSKFKANLICRNFDSIFLVFN